MALSRVYPTLGSVIVPRQGGDGGAPSKRVSEELDSIISGVNDLETNVNSLLSARVIPLALSSGEGATTTNIETDLRAVNLPPNLIQNGDHLVFQAGGFVLASGGDISNIHFRGRLQPNSPDTWWDQNINQNMPNGSSSTWYLEGHLARNDSGGTVEIGGMFLWSGPTPFFTVLRGELTGAIANWGNPLTFRITSHTTITAGIGFVVSETFALYKHSIG